MNKKHKHLEWYANPACDIPAMEQNIEKPFYYSVHTLRGIACLIILFHHLWLFYPNIGIVAMATSKMFLGVQIFFVISGFIIPYSMYLGNYHHNNIGKFIWKRIVRIEPLYLIVIITTVLINLYLRTTYHLSYKNLFLHIGYLIPFSNEKWISSVFWTLAIEFQFYLTISIFYPLLHYAKKHVILTLLVLPVSFIFHKSEMFLFHWITFFVLGIFTFLYKINKFKKYEYILGLVVFFAILKIQISFVFAFTGVFSSVYIVCFTKQTRLLNFFGTISYSLYITHWTYLPLIHYFYLTNFKVTPHDHYLLFISSGMICIGIAYVYYLTIEKPFLSIAKKIKYKKVEQLSTNKKAIQLPN